MLRSESGAAVYFGKKLKGGAIQDFDLKKVKVGQPRTLKKKKEKMKK